MSARGCCLELREWVGEDSISSAEFCSFLPSFQKGGKRRIRAFLYREFLEIYLMKAEHRAEFTWRSAVGERVLQCVTVTSRASNKEGTAGERAGVARVSPRSI